MRQLAISLDVILATAEVPHEVAQIHEVDLVAQEETQVLAKGRDVDDLLLPIALHLDVVAVCSVEAAPRLILGHVWCLWAVHSGEEDLCLVFVLGLVFSHDIFAVFYHVDGSALAVIGARVCLW